MHRARWSRRQQFAHKRQHMFARTPASKAGMGVDHPVTLKVLLGSNSVVDRRFLPPGCTSWMPGACSCIHTQNHTMQSQQSLLLVCACERQFSTRANRCVSPRRPCGSDEPCPRFARFPGAPLGCRTTQPARRTTPARGVFFVFKSVFKYRKEALGRARKTFFILF